MYEDVRDGSVDLATIQLFAKQGEPHFIRGSPVLLVRSVVIICWFLCKLNFVFGGLLSVKANFTVRSLAVLAAYCVGTLQNQVHVTY